MYLAEATPGQWPQDYGGGQCQVPATRDQPWLALVLWAVLPRLTRPLCVHLPATVSGFLWKGEGRQAGSELRAAQRGVVVCV